MRSRQSSDCLSIFSFSLLIAQHWNTVRCYFIPYAKCVFQNTDNYANRYRTLYELKGLRLPCNRLRHPSIKDTSPVLHYLGTRHDQRRSNVIGTPFIEFCLILFFAQRRCTVFCTQKAKQNSQQWRKKESNMPKFLTSHPSKLLNVGRFEIE